MGLKDIIRIVFIIGIHIFVGRKLAYSSALHAYRLNKKARLALFVIDIEMPVISVAAIIWQVLLYVTIIFFVSAFFVFEIESFLKLLYSVVLCEWLIVGLSLFLYACISAIILSKKR